MESNTLEPWVIQQDEKSETRESLIAFKTQYLNSINLKNPTNHSLLTLYLNMNDSSPKSNELSQHFLNLIYNYFRK